MNLVETAQRLADDVLFPAALATDASERLPVELLDVLAAEGLYGIVGPESADGAGANLLEFCAVIEALASGCLTTTFVWVQHHGAVRAAMLTENEAVRDWLPTLCRGGWRAGLALGGAIAGEPRLVARKVDAGWQLDGVSPFVSGWGRIDVVLTLARTEDGRLVSLLLDARENETLAVSRLRLVALNATATVSASFRGHVVPGERVTSIAPYVEGPTPPEVIRIHAAQALGVASRCCRLLGPSPLDEEARPSPCRARPPRPGDNRDGARRGGRARGACGGGAGRPLGQPLPAPRRPPAAPRARGAVHARLRAAARLARRGAQASGRRTSQLWFERKSGPRTGVTSRQDRRVERHADRVVDVRDRLRHDPAVDEHVGGGHVETIPRARLPV